jgi:Predicted membrane protein (DUF2142)
MATSLDPPTQGHGRWLRLLLIAVALWVCMLTWALSSPPGSSPDEDAHLAAAWAVTHGESPNGKLFSVPQVLFPEYCYPPAIPEGPCYTPTGAIGSELVTHTNLTAGYPAAFHWLEGKFFRPGLTASVLSIRAFVSFVCVLLIMVPLVLISVTAGDDALRAVGLPLVAILSPLAFFMFGSVNPSSWEMAGAVCGWGCYVALVLANRRSQVFWAIGGMLIGVLAGAVARPSGGLVLLASLPLAGPIVLARIAPAPADQRRRFWTIVGACYATVGAIAVALIFRGALTIRWSNHPPADPHSRVWHWLSDALRAGDYVLGSFGGGHFGALGWLDTPMPAFVPLVFVAASGYLVIAAIRQSRPEVTLSLLMTSLGSLFLTTAVLASGIPPDGSVQSRYLWPAYIGVPFAAVASLGMGNRAGGARVPRGHLRWVAGGALVAATSVGFFTNLWRYTTGLDEFPYLSPMLWHPSVLSFGELVVVFVAAYVALVYLLTARSVPTLRRQWFRARTSGAAPSGGSASPAESTLLEQQSP